MKRLFDPKTYEKLVDDQYRYFLQMKLACVLLGCTALIMAVLNGLAGQRLMTGVTACFFLICCINLLLLRRFRRMTVANRLLLIVPVFLVCTFFLLSGGAEGFSPYWILIVPSCMMTLLGRKKGVVLVGCVWGMIVFLLWTSLGRALLQYDYGIVFCQRFPVVYLVCALIGYGFETSRYLALKQMFITQDKMRLLSETDRLTGLRNRHWFQERMAYLAHKPVASDGCTAYLLMDIDGFKKINDTYGHKTGDLVLMEVAGVLQESFGPDELLCRWGGEEFLAYMPFCTAETARERAEKICRLVGQMTLHSTDDRELKATVSVGVVVIPGSIQLDESAAFIEADKQLYTAKEQGRNRVNVKIMM